MSYRIDEIEGIGPAYREKLAQVSIATTDDLLKLCCDRKGREEIAEKSGVSTKLILKWANMADLMRVSGIGGEYAELLEAAGVDTIKELRNRNAANLAAAMKQANEEKKLTRMVPSESTVEKWVEQAGELEPTITH
ncbi:MAG TPA: DUF4332 domain-containing protein [Gammaproteobacteria bacterium]|nr:DUF4332 domain-containing protein [Gammaproteobacteria bacterium]